MDSFTGLNVEQAKTDIVNFNELASDISYKLADSFNDFGEYLGSHWAGPKAVNFTDTYEPKIRDFMSDFYNWVIHIVDGASVAATNLARAFGTYVSLPEGYIDNNGQSIIAHFSLKCEEDINGNVGMDTEGVRVNLDIFKMKANKEMSRLEALPTSIAFYDPQGALINQYSTNVNTMKTRLSEYNCCYGDRGS